MGLTHVQLGCDLTQSALVPFSANQTGLRMFGHHQPDDIPPVIHDARGVGLNRHILCHRRNTGRHDATGLFILHDTKPAGTGRFKYGMMTEGGNFYADLFS